MKAAPLVWFKEGALYKSLTKEIPDFVTLAQTLLRKGWKL
jgi:hypothetical protein